jgi:hypothetical protein
MELMAGYVTLRVLKISVDVQTLLTARTVTVYCYITLHAVSGLGTWHDPVVLC